MKKLLLLLVLLISLSVRAEEKCDSTLIRVGKQNVVVIQDSTTTCVKVYGSDGKAWVKTREVTFNNGQEVEQVFVLSPFFPVRKIAIIKYLLLIFLIFIMGLTYYVQVMRWKCAIPNQANGAFHLFKWGYLSVEIIAWGWCLPCSSDLYTTILTHIIILIRWIIKHVCNRLMKKMLQQVS